MPTDLFLNSRLLVLLCLGVLIGEQWGCTSRYTGRNLSSECTTPDCIEGQEVANGYCINDTDCAANEYCASGLCADRNPTTNPDTACSTHNDCPTGGFCNLATGICVDCLLDDHCDIDEICQSNGSCGSGLGCTTNADCNGLICETSTGECHQCLDNSHCQAGQSCREHRCVFDNSDSIPCTTQSDCDPFGRICDGATQTCLPCSNDNQCGPGRVCNAGVCTNDSSGGNTGGNGSGSGTSQNCNSRDDCNGYACFMGECMPCFADAMCTDFTDIVTGVTMVCELSTGNCIETECNSAADCPTPLGCWQGQCVSCIADNECRSGEICNAVGECVPQTSGCTSNSQCFGGQVCVGGACRNCNSSTQCDPGQTCNQFGRCESGTTTPDGNSSTWPSLGESCSESSQCSGGLNCITVGTESFCSQSCIGSGGGNEVDCPSGFACYKFSSFTFGMCLPSTVMVDSTGTALAGAPYNLQPGANCEAGNGCQTMYCDSTNNACSRLCNADRDCYSGETCYTAWVPAETPAAGYVILDIHYCIGSDTMNFQAPGGACTSGVECDTGICRGTCDNNPNQLCNQSTDCDNGGTCGGTCKAHCRSNNDCLSNETCTGWPTTTDSTGYEGWTTICHDKFGFGTTPNGGSCSTSTDCASDWCVGGSCTTNCVVPSDCNQSLPGSSCAVTRVGDSNGNTLYSTQFCQ